MAATDKIEATRVVFGKEKDKLIRFSYLHIHKPHLNNESKRHEYSLSILVPKENKADYAAAKAAVDAQLKAHFPSGKYPPRIHSPIKDGDKDVNQKGEPLNVPGYWIISAKTDAFERIPGTTQEDTSKPCPAPEVVGTMRGADGKLKPLSSAEIKSGDWGRVSVVFRGYTKGDGGVGVYLSNLQKVRDGDPLGGGRKAAADEFAEFEDYEEEDEALS